MCRLRRTAQPLLGQPLRQQLSRPRQPSRYRRGSRRRCATSDSAWRRSASSAARRRFIGTGVRDRAVSRKDDAILFAACFDANGGLFEALLGPEDAIVSDALNHASIIDGIRLCKAKRYRFANSNMDELEDRLKQADAEGARLKLIATDGVFSMDGYVANLPAICALAERYGAMVMVDDCHATGHLGAGGARHAGAHRRRRARRHRHRHLRQDAGRRHGRLRRCAQPIVDIFGSTPGPISFPTAWRRRLLPAR